MLKVYYGIRRVRQAAFTRLVRRELAACGPHSSIGYPIELAGAENIQLGTGVLIFPGCIVQSYLGGRIEIGDRVEVYERAVITSQLSVVIEPGCGIGRGVHISDHSHTYDNPNLDFVDQPSTEPQPVRIRQGAWISNGVIVMPGVTVGRRAVVGAGSVVTRDIPDYAVAIGSPARVVKSYA